MEFEDALDATALFEVFNILNEFIAVILPLSPY
jgi:hypothetical protein